VALYAGIAATSQAIAGLLVSAARDSEFSGASIGLATSADLQKALPERPSVTLYLYRVGVDQARRNLPPRRSPDGRLHPSPMPVNLHYLVTAWSRDPVTQHRLLGWCIRVIQDTPTLPAGVLNQFTPEPEVFGPQESVELIFEALTRQEMGDAWEVAKANQQPSAAYVARTVEIESDVIIREYEPVQTRDLRYHKVEA
jgi:hypothetical protein